MRSVDAPANRRPEPPRPAHAPADEDVAAAVAAVEAEPVPAPGTPPGAVEEAVRIVAWLSIAAGAIHGVAMIDHFSHYWLYGAFFLVLTYGQVLWGINVLRKPVEERSLRISAAANLAIVAVWLLSRTVGIPFGRYAWQPEAVGVTDVAAVLDQLVLVAYVVAITRPHLRTVRGLKLLMGRHRVRLGMALCSATVFAAVLGAGHHHH